LLERRSVERSVSHPMPQSKHLTALLVQRIAQPAGRGEALKADELPVQMRPA
jgi:hypothetical protein